MATGFGIGPTFESSNLRRILVPGVVLLVLLAITTRSGAAERIWRAITGNRMPVDAPVPVAVAKPALSEHEREWLNTQPPQTQMEELMRAAINHEEGATQMIAEKLPSWHERLRESKGWNDQLMTALYSNDLRVRAAAIEINLEVYHVSKTNAMAGRLMDNAEANPSARPWAAWMLGMLANRGVETDKIVATLETWAHDPDEQTRVWAVEGLANVGTDSTINDFVSLMKTDDSPLVRERAGCSLAKSGMLTRVQRMHAVPGLLDVAAESTIDPQTRKWVFQALHEITEENLSDDPGAWRDWYLEHGQEKIERFSASDGNDVLGNS